MSFLGKAQDNYMTPWDTVIVADNETYKFYVHSVSYSLNGDSVVYFRGEYSLKSRKKTWHQFNVILKWSDIAVDYGKNTCKLQYTQTLTKAKLTEQFRLIILSLPTMGLTVAPLILTGASYIVAIGTALGLTAQAQKKEVTETKKDEI